MNESRPSILQDARRKFGTFTETVHCEGEDVLFETTHQLRIWANSLALGHTGVTATLSEAKTTAREGVYALQLNLSPHPFAGGMNTMSYPGFQRVLEWAQGDPGAQLPMPRAEM